MSGACQGPGGALSYQPAARPHWQEARNLRHTPRLWAGCCVRSGSSCTARLRRDLRNHLVRRISGENQEELKPWAFTGI